MLSKKSSSVFATTYLLLVPVLTAVAGFGIGYISYKIYLPVWIVNVFLMVISIRILNGKSTTETQLGKKQKRISAMLLIAPWLLISIFFGLGPPPTTMLEWVNSAYEQELRYTFLIISGVLIATGFVLLRENLKTTAGSWYALIGCVFMLIAIPLFMLNMSFWRSFLTETYRITVGYERTGKPDWLLPAAKLFGSVSAVEVSLTYLATAAFARALYLANSLSKKSFRIYFIISLTAFVVVTMDLFSFDPSWEASYFLTIPAIPFLMPYYLGVNLLKKDWPVYSSSR